MAIYRVRGPDGAVYKIEGPDNATPQEVEAFAAQQFQKPQEPSAPQAPAIEDPGFGQSALIGAGRTLDRLWEGAKQMGLNVAALGSDKAKEALAEQAKREAENTAQYAKLQQLRPWATGIGEAAPLLAAPILGSGVAGIAASAALPGLIEYGTPQERLARGGMGAAGGAVGAVAGKALGAAIKPTAELSQTQQKAIESANRLGVKLTSGEASGSRALRWAESASADIPGASAIASARTKANEKAMAAAAARSIGQNATELTDDVLATARTAISGEYQRILNPLKITLDQPFKAEVNAITGSKVMKELRDESVDAILDQFRNIPAGKVSVTGEWFQQNKTALDQAIRAAYNNSQPGKARALESFERALDRAASRSMSAEDREAYKLAQRQWANLRIIETGKVLDEGRIMPGRLKSALESRYKQAFKEGKIKGELSDIASLAGTLRQPPQSGTVPRAFYTGAGLVGAAMEPVSTASALAAPALLQGITASPAMRNYMTKGLIDLGPEELALLSRGGGYAGLLGAYGANQ